MNKTPELHLLPENSALCHPATQNSFTQAAEQNPEPCTAPWWQLQSGFSFWTSWAFERKVLEVANKVTEQSSGLLSTWRRAPPGHRAVRGEPRPQVRGARKHAARPSAAQPAGHGVGRPRGRDPPGEVAPEPPPRPRGGGCATRGGGGPAQRRGPNGSGGGGPRGPFKRAAGRSGPRPAAWRGEAEHAAAYPCPHPSGRRGRAGPAPGCGKGAGDGVLGCAYRRRATPPPRPRRPRRGPWTAAPPRR